MQMQIEPIQEQAEEEEQHHPTKSLINIHLIKKINREMQAQQQEKSKQELAIETGMFFPDIVLMTIVCDKKSEHSEVLKKDQEYTVTSHSFGSIPIANITKIKIYSNKIPKKVILKIQEEDEFKPAIFHVRNQDITQLFSKLLWVRLATMNVFTSLDVRFEDQISGQVLKHKSIEYFGKWVTKDLKITKKKGLMMTSKEKIGSSVHLQTVSQFWTRFQIIDNRAYLVVKLMAGMFKYEIGIPISSRIIEWMQAFCSILKH